jgi:putative ABC transport system permease protein
MLQLKEIVKDYPVASGAVHALKGISLTFRNNEFVSILGPSGCGKTTMLNIIGGLDQYTRGDLVINGVSTKKYKDRDWDTYRNHSVGFVFQTYNLIPHQTVLQNVEIALTLSGVHKSERKARAIEALKKVGLGDQIHKRPNAMSGGQMQRVAIARALVNNPDIILADEPTGALDTQTSVQVMEILKEVAKDRLVVMVTHNPDLADKYSTRIIRMLDGKITNDSQPVSAEEYAKLKAEEEALSGVKKYKTVCPKCKTHLAIKGAEGMVAQCPNCGEMLSYKLPQKTKKEGAGTRRKLKKPTMSFFTALRLSLKNLFTKKGRTILTSFAGSIGIIGIALILAVSQGTTAYIDYVQESTLSSYPLTLESSTLDVMSIMESFLGVGTNREDHRNEENIYKDPIIGELVEALSKVKKNDNDLKSFKTYLDGQIKDTNSKLSSAVSGVQYGYDLELSVYTENVDGEIIKSDTNELMQEMLKDFFTSAMQSGGLDMGNGFTSDGSSSMLSSMMNMKMWQEILPANDGGAINPILYEQYDLINGGWPNDYNEIVLVVNENNELDDLTLYALGLLSQAEIDEIIDCAASGKPLPEGGEKKWPFSELSKMQFTTILPADCYQKVGNIYSDMSNNESILRTLYQNEEKTTKLNVVGIIRPKKDATATMLSAGIGYTYHLTEHVIKRAVESDVVKAQLANPNVDVLTGLPFKSNVGTMTNEEKETAFRAYVNGLSQVAKAETYVKIQCVNAEQEHLQTQTDAWIASFTNKEDIIKLIAQIVSANMGLAPEEVEVAFTELAKDMDINQLKALVRPYAEEIVKVQIKQQVEQALSAVPIEQKAMLLDMEMAKYDAKTCALYYDKVTVFSESTYEENLALLGHLDYDSPFTINIYASTFEDKDVIAAEIEVYNKSVPTEKQIKYTDYMGLIMSSVTSIIDAVTYVLIAFVAISLIVSSIMIGVITLISVQERTKEIGILRAIGASKRDVSSMFNAETLIIGFSSGLLGVLVTYLLCVPINIILYALTGLATLQAVLPIGAAVILVVISMGLTLISGIIPSRSAAKKDPVVALRSE